MKSQLLACILFLCIIANSKPIYGVNLPDSLVTIENVYVYCLSEPDKAQMIIGRLRKLNDPKLAFDYEMDWAQADLYFNVGKYRLASYYFERVMGYKQVKTNRKFMMGLLSTMLECYRMNNNMDKAMETAIALLKITEADGVKEETGRAYQYMGEIMASRNDSLESIRYFELAEQQLKESKHIPYLYQCYISYANVLLANGQYHQALTMVRSAGKIIDQVAKDPNMWPEGYEAFETSRFKAFAAEVFAKNGKTSEAEEYYQGFTAQCLTNSTENKIPIVPYLLTSKRYHEAIAISLEREDYLREHTDTIGDNMMAVKGYLAMAYEGLGMKDREIEQLRQQLSIKEQLRSRQLSSISQELAVIYETEKKDAELKEKDAAVRFQNFLLLALSVISTLAISITVISIRNQKNTKRNNHLMAHQIKEMKALKQLQDEWAKEISTMGEVEPFTQLELLMKQEKLYCDATCNRDMIVSRLGIDKNDLPELLRSNKIDNLSDYINRYRLEEAIVLLDKDSSIPLEEIARQAGFGSLRSLQRHFKEKYNMSIGEYKKLVTV